jgi:hypothetical protein
MEMPQCVGLSIKRLDRADYLAARRLHKIDDSIEDVMKRSSSDDAPQHVQLSHAAELRQALLGDIPCRADEPADTLFIRIPKRPGVVADPTDVPIPRDDPVVAGDRLTSPELLRAIDDYLMFFRMNDTLPANLLELPDAVASNPPQSV